MGRKPSSSAAIRGRNVQIAGIDEYDSILVNIGESQQPCFLGDSGICNRNQQYE